MKRWLRDACKSGVLLGRLFPKSKGMGERNIYLYHIIADTGPLIIVSRAFKNEKFGSIHHRLMAYPSYAFIILYDGSSTAISL